MRNSILKNKNALCVFICMVIPLLCEITVFQYSHYRSLGCEEQIIAADLDISGFTEYDTPAFAADREVRNICISGVSLSGTDEIKLRAELSDEGDKYLYPLSDTEIEAGSAAAVKHCINIYPYGKVHEIYAHFTIPEGAEVRVDKISINAKVPMDIKPLRCLVLFLITLFLTASFVPGDSLPVCSRTSKLQQVCILLFILTVLALGWGLSRSNTKLYSGAYAHHAQYQELARALKDGHCDLFFYPADGRLKTAENPYDTSSLQVEGIEYLPDYAYFDGKYYVYFGIIPELLLYLPWHLATGRDLANANAAFVFYALFVISFFALIWEAVHRYGNGRLPFHLYLGLCVTGCFFANNVFMISRPDIYNIPILAATAFLTAGCALYLKAADFKGKGDTAAACLGSFCLAATAGCRPQLLLYALPMLVLIMIQYVKKQGFDRKRIPALLAIFLPWVVMAIPVCVYNHARFGSVLDFGATYSLTSNDMNHRGFNAERLVRGLYCFLFQPPVYTTDFPYLKSSILKSSYMGKNLVEFTFGGIFAAIPLTLAVFFPFFGAGKKMGRQEKCIWQCLFLSSLVIAAFDVNNAGILYRYTCDLAPGMLYASMLVWIVLAGREKKAGAVGKVLPLLMVFSICFAFLVFVAGGDAINIHDGNPSLYEHIRSYF